MTETTGRRNVLQRLGLLGAALPVTALLACTDKGKKDWDKPASPR